MRTPRSKFERILTRFIRRNYTNNSGDSSDVYIVCAASANYGSWRLLDFHGDRCHHRSVAHNKNIRIRLARYNLSRDTFFGNHCSPTSQRERERERERSSISPSREREEDQDPIVDNAFSLSLHTGIRVRTRNGVESKGIYKSFFIFGPVWLCYRYLDAFPSCPDLSIYARLAGVGGREGERKIEYLLARGSNKREKGSSKSGASLTREEEGDAKKRERERENERPCIARHTR